MEEIKSPGERCGLYVGVKVQCRLEQGLTKGICSVTVFVSAFRPMIWSTCSSLSLGLDFNIFRTKQKTEKIDRKFDNQINVLNTYQDKKKKKHSLVPENISNVFVFWGVF